MRTLYIADKTVWERHNRLFHDSHWLPTDDPTKILIICTFTHDGNADSWEALLGVEALPHPFLSSGTPIGERHALILKGMGVHPGHTVIDVARAAGKLHPHFRPERLY